MSEHHENRILWAVLITAFLTPFNGSAMNMCLPAMQQAFHVSTQVLSWTVELYLLVCTVCLLPAGKYANIHGKKKVYLTGVILYTLGAALMHFVPSYGWILALCVMQGLGSAMMFATGIAIVSLAFPQERRGKALGIVTAVIYIGLALGPAVGGYLTYHFGWRSVFYLTAFIGFVGTVMTLLFIKEEWVSEPEGKLHIESCLAYALALIGIMFGLSEWLNLWWAKYTVLAGILIAIYFVRRQLTVKYPLLPVRIFVENRVFAFSNLAAMLNYCATFALAFLLSLYLQLSQGYNPQDAGLVMLIQTIVMAALSPMMGSLSDRYSAAKLSSLGMGLIGIGLAGIVYAVLVSQVSIIMGCLVVIGVGFACFSAPNNNAIMASVKPNQIGLASATISTVRLLGQVVSMAIVAFVLSLPHPALGVHEAFKMNVVYSFGIFTAICFLGMLPSLARNRGDSVG